MSTGKEPTCMIGNSIETDAALTLVEEHRSFKLAYLKTKEDARY